MRPIPRATGLELPRNVPLLNNKTNMKHELLGARVLVEVSGGEVKTASGLLLNVETAPDDMRVGTVVLKGDGHYVGEMHIAVNPDVGDKVMFQYGGAITVDGKHLFLVNEADVIMIMKEDETNEG